jgi:putative ABC transport system permease protein
VRGRLAASGGSVFETSRIRNFSDLDIYEPPRPRLLESATFLAALGLYGVVSLAAARRRHEIAIRMSVGASHPDIFRLVILKAVRLTLASVAVGLFCGIGTERAIVSLLYDVRATDPKIYAGACVIVISVSLLASVLPAQRAASVDPVVALKYE